MLLAVDPGYTSGIVYATEEGLIEWVTELTTIAQFEKFYTRKKDFMVTKCICEDFRIRAGAAKTFIGRELKTVKIIGVLEFIYGNDLILQQPAIKQAWNNTRLMNVFPSETLPKSTHIKDAMIHLAHYVTRGYYD